MERFYISKAGFEKMSLELEKLKGPKRKQITILLAEARAFGDLSENAEYEAAKQEQLLNELRINEFETRLSQTEILGDDVEIASDKVYLGATVKLLDIDFNEEECFKIVGSMESDGATGSISTESPVGKALLGHKVDDVVEIAVPRGKLRYRVLEITRD